MFKVIKFQNFRGFNEATVSGLTRINVITGLNGSGKTSILEAVFLVCGAANAGLVASMYGFRGDNMFTTNVDRPFRSLFKDLDPTIIPKISASTSVKLSGGKYRRELQIKPTYSLGKGLTTTAQSSFLSGVTFEFVGPSGKKISNWGWSTHAGNVDKNKIVENFIRLGGEQVDNPDLIFAQFVSPYVRDIAPQNHSALTKLVTGRRIKDVVDVLKLIDSSITSTEPLTEEGEPVIYADIGGKALLPISLLGTGFSNCLHIILPLVVNRNSVILIDEFEDGLHHSLFKPLLKVVFNLARKNNNQIFLSTHSNEFLYHLIEMAKEEDEVDDVSFFRLAKKGINGLIPRYSLSEADSLLDSNLDLR